MLTYIYIICAYTYINRISNGRKSIYKSSLRFLDKNYLYSTL